MTSWITFSILVKIVCAASFIATIVGMVQVVKAWRKNDRTKEGQWLIILCPSAAVCGITFWGAFLVDAAIAVLFQEG